MRHAATLLAAALVCLASAPAAAEQLAPVEIETTSEDYQSPQHFALELKLGYFSPDIDSTSGLTGTPFADLFNDQYDKDKVDQTTGKSLKRPDGKPLFSLEFDWQFWHPFGSFGLALSAGFYSRNTHAFQYVQAGDTQSACKVPNCVRSGDITTFSMLPVTLELVYRFDVLALRWNIPVVPYIKGGLAYYIWYIQNGAGSIAKSLDGASSAYGGTAGWVLHPGVAIMLDIFDKQAARTLDSELGINHSYIFAELNYAQITGLGFKDKLVLSDTSWNAGIAFEF